MTTQLSMLSAIIDGHEAPLRAALAALPVRDGSPFAEVEGTHNGRFVVVNTEAAPSATLRAGGLEAPLLMCSAVIDRPPHEWLNDLLTALGEAADAIWSHCPGWPAATDDRVGYLLGCRVRSSLDFATWDVPVDEILDSLAVHARVTDFAVRSQHLDADELLAAYREEFST